NAYATPKSIIGKLGSLIVRVDGNQAMFGVPFISGGSVWARRRCRHLVESIVTCGSRRTVNLLDQPVSGTVVSVGKRPRRSCSIRETRGDELVCGIVAETVNERSLRSKLP